MHKFSVLNKFVYILFGLLVLSTLIFFHVRGITYFDEGYILNSALRSAHGQIPYRDFDMVYTPFSFLFTAVFLQMFGESVLAGRLAALSISLFSIGAIYLLLSLFTNNRFIIFTTILFYLSWGPTHINFPWPTMFALCFLLYAAYFYLLGILRSTHTFFFFAGILTVLVFLSKQNFGGGALLVFTTAFLFLNITDKKEKFFSYIAGIIALATGYLLFLLATSSLLPFLQNMYLYTLQRVFVDKSLETPFIYEGSFFARIAKTLFYTSPLVVALAALRVIPKQKKVFVILPILTGMFYILGIRPTTDYVHVVALLAMSSISVAILLTFIKEKVVRYLFCAFVILMTVLGFYTAYFKGYYQWEQPLSKATTYVSYERAQIFLNAQKDDELKKLVTFIQSRTKSDDYIFINAYEPMVYFLSGRKNPTPYDLISINQLPLSYQQNIIFRLQEQNVRFVLMHDLHRNENSIVANYIRKNYKNTKNIGGFIVYEK
jgi:hypothetical protein